MSQAEKLCDRFAIIDQGEIKANGTLEELRDLADEHYLEKIFLQNRVDDCDDRPPHLWRATARGPAAIHARPTGRYSSVVLPIVSIPLMLGGVDEATEAGEKDLQSRVISLKHRKFWIHG